MSEHEGLQVALDRMRANRAPLPLTRHAAVEYGVRLRRKGWTWTAISKVRADYHGVCYCSSWWYRSCRAAGAAPRPGYRPAPGRSA
jgi:hypothetical protein